ncbi:SIR2 family protein [Nonlabens sp. Asnod3-H03]|uniref:SIR2 family protein n=1 Tax=Nonlabens sp. Asnod3-H03 TaxID=3160580 RepID=UPI003868C541
MNKSNIIREIQELKNQLSYSKNVGFFFGAGTSTALGIPNIAQLTKGVEDALVEELLQNYIIVKKDLETTFTDKTINIEDILNQIRRIREITGEKKDKRYLEIDGESAKSLDIEICNKIHNILSEKEKTADIKNTKKLMAWMNMQNRDFSKEIFTSNYDLIFEKSLEETQIPYFDGFVGSYEPFFLAENVERFVDNNDITKSWIRLWKIHGSLSWFWKKDITKNSYRIVRLGKIDNIEKEGNEVVIYPSKEKYDSSRKQPFISYFDRLKTFLTNGELLFIISGYSFSDQHINEVIFNSLRQNNRLHIVVFAYSDETVKELYKLSSSYLNIGAFGPKNGIVNGELIEWTADEEELKDDKKSSYYWKDDSKELIIGDFNKLIDFIVTNSGKKETIEKLANE